MKAKTLIRLASVLASVAVGPFGCQCPGGKSGSPHSVPGGGSVSVSAAHGSAKNQSDAKQNLITVHVEAEDQVVKLGGTATFMVLVDDDDRTKAKYTYQWLKNGTAINKDNQNGAILLTYSLRLSSI
jgi:hypothetical protein